MIEPQEVLNKAELSSSSREIALHVDSVHGDVDSILTKSVKILEQ
jgi:hypothetical protein